MSFYIRELNNGIKAILEKSDSQVMHLALTVRSGTRDEQKDESGMAHFTEHCLFKGTKSKNAIQILNALDSVGGELNAYTTKEETCIYASCDVAFAHRSFELISDIIFHSVYPQKEVAKEKTVVIDEIFSYLDTPQERIYDEFDELLFPDHPIGGNILGTTKSVKTFNANSVKKFVERTYRPEIMTISVSGKFTNKEFDKLVERFFAHKFPKSKADNVRLPVCYGKKFHEKRKYNTYQDHMIIGGKSFDYHHPKRLAMLLLNNVLGGQAMNSRLNIAIREKKGYTYTVESSYTAFSDGGTFSVYFGTDKKYTSKCQEIVRKEMNNFMRKKLTTTELNAAKAQLIGQMRIGDENRVNRVIGLGKSLLIFGRVYTPEEIIKKIRAISSADILESANEVFRPENLGVLHFKS